MTLIIRQTDSGSRNSPNTGHPDCICSRCGSVITENQVPIRMWDTNQQGNVDEQSLEYRYCEKCQESAGLLGPNNKTIEEEIEELMLAVRMAKTKIQSRDTKLAEQAIDYALEIAKRISLQIIINY
jgi:hypothetical protein